MTKKVNRKEYSFKDYGAVLKELNLLTDEFRVFLKNNQVEMVTYPYSNNKIFGSVEKGSLVDKSIELAEIATHLNEEFYGGLVDNVTIARACILSQLSKTQLYEPTTEDWEIKRGILWKFANQDKQGGAKLCEMSYLIARNLNLNITNDEYEAIMANDKELDDNKINLYGSLIERIMRQANAILTTRNNFNINVSINNNETHFLTKKEKEVTNE